MNGTGVVLQDYPISVLAVLSIECQLCYRLLLRRARSPVHPPRIKQASQTGAPFRSSAAARLRPGRHRGGRLLLFAEGAARHEVLPHVVGDPVLERGDRAVVAACEQAADGGAGRVLVARPQEIGRASCRERG